MRWLSGSKNYPRYKQVIEDFLGGGILMLFTGSFHISDGQYVPSLDKGLYVHPKELPELLEP